MFPSVFQSITPRKPHKTWWKVKKTIQQSAPHAKQQSNETNSVARQVHVRKRKSTSQNLLDSALHTGNSLTIIKLVLPQV